MALPRAGRWIAGLIVLLAAAAAARGAIDAPRGLRADYFLSLTPGGPPDRTLVSSGVSTRQIDADWRGAAPEVFRARWYGYLAVLQPGRYMFATTSDDGSRLTIGDRLVVDNGGVHGPTTRRGEVELDRGVHAVLIEYEQAGGFYQLEWEWGREAGALSPVPAWRLSPGRVPLWAVVTVRALDWTILAGLIALVLPVATLVFGPGSRTTRAVSRYPRAASLCFFVALACLHTWPLVTSPGRLSRQDNGDYTLNAWAIAWVAHQAPRAPLRLFDANIFYPERHTLAYSETMIVQSTLAAPLLWLGASPVLAYNLVLLAGFALTGWTTSLVAARWTGDWTAGLVAGAVGGINAHTLTRLPHLQAQHPEFLPLALFALDAVLREPRAARSLRLALWYVLQSLTSVYLLVFTTFALAAGALARPEDWRGARFVPAVRGVGLAALVAMLALLPFLLPYWWIYSGQGMTRSMQDAAQYSASLGDYLTTPARIHQTLWSAGWTSGTGLFPGALGLALAVGAGISGVAFRDRRARMCVAVGLCGLILSFGAKLPGYATLYELVPLLHAIRAPVRFGYLVIVAVALLAGFGVAVLRQRVPARMWRPIAAALVLIAALEPLAAPLRLRAYHGIPAIYERLRDEPDAVVAELPLPHPRAVFRNAGFLLNSTAHWKPMIYGYSGFLPESYRRHYARLGTFPSSDAVDALGAFGVTHAFVHVDRFGAEAVDALNAMPGLELIAREGPIALYRVTRP